MNRLSSFRIPVLLALFALLLPQNAEAQYFGRNKVQYETFDFKRLETEHFTVYFYEEERQAAEDVARMAERWYARLSKVFGHTFEKKPIVLYANHADFQQTTTTGGLIGEGTGGFTDAFKNRIVMPLTGSYAETDHVLGHEMVHVFQYDIAAGQTDVQRRFQLQQMPLWMIEGLAEYLSQGRHDPQTAMWLRDSYIHDMLPDMRRLTRDPRYSPYQYGQGLWAYIGGRWGDAAVIEVFLTAGRRGLEEAFLRVLGVSSTEVIEGWHESTRRLYQPVVMGRIDPTATGRAVLEEKKTRGEVNIAPSLSPDGRSVAFLSTRSLFSIDLFLADAETGEVKHRIISSQANPHFDALRFIDSAGSWSPDGRKLVIVAFEKGDNILAIVDAESGRIEQRIRVEGVGAMSNPAWSPDGSRIAFSGAEGGMTDLFVYDMSSRRLTRLTQDRYADLHPAWSPDGRRLAFATDRGPGTDFGLLTFEKMRIATIDVATAAIDLLPLFENSRHINPQFSPDGESIYFIADPEGIPDIFRYSPNVGIERITRVTTGVTGITDLSPALSVASRSGRVMYSVLERSNWSIYGLSPTEIPAERVSGTERTARAGVLPPGDEIPQETFVESYLEQPRGGLPPAGTEFETGRYRARLGLDYVGPPAIGVGVDQFGLGVGGSVSAYFSDVLGHHQFGVALQGGSGTGSLGDQLGAELFYLNQQHRINWGSAALHIPYTSGFTRVRRDFIEVDGQTVLADIVEQRIERVTVNQASLFSQYPLSPTRRFEATGSYTNLGFDNELEQFVIVGNRIIDRNFVNLGAPPDLAYTQGSVAYVGDSSIFGFVSPIQGTRYRFEAGTTFGDVEFQTALADYRRYTFFNPMTLAVRGLHYGRYGDGSEDDRITPLTIAQTSLVRGYSFSSFNAGLECTRPEGSNFCPELERLIGSKVGVVNLELRVPLFGTDKFGLINLPSVPTELLGFIDGGVAWTEDESPTLEFAERSIERIPVFSAGIAARIVLGGYLPLEFFYAFPFQRPDENGVFGFAIRPGW